MKLLDLYLRRMLKCPPAHQYFRKQIKMLVLGSKLKKVLFTPLGGVGCQKIILKIVSGKNTTMSIFIDSILVPVSKYKKVPFAQPGGLGYKNK